MLRNVSYNNNEIKQEILKLAGPSFSLKQRLKMGGSGSQRFVIHAASEAIEKELKKDSNLNYASIELRQKAVILRFRSLLETFAWVVPFTELSMHEIDNFIRIENDNAFVLLQPAYNAKYDRAFFDKIQKQKQQYLSSIT